MLDDAELHARSFDLCTHRWCGCAPRESRSAKPSRPSTRSLPNGVTRGNEEYVIILYDILTQRACGAYSAVKMRAYMQQSNIVRRDCLY